MPDDILDWEADLSPEAKALLEKMMPYYYKKLNEIKKIPISVLIWGPTPSSSSVIGEMRKKLRRELRIEGNLAMFSEELCDEKSDYSIRLQQLIQAEQFDLIISIPESFGSIAEIHDFTADTRVNKKILIFLNEEFAEGYSTKSLYTMSSLISSEIVLYRNDNLEKILEVSLNTVNKIKEYKYILGGRF